MLRQALPLFLVLAPIAARAQAPVPVLTPVSIQSGAQIQIPVPARAEKPRLQVLLAGSNTVLDDERATIQGGSAVARLEADPGLYDVRLVSNDKTRTPLSGVTRFQISGFKREAGRWLFDGSPVVYEGSASAAPSTISTNLRRDQKLKLPVSVATNGPLKWDIRSFGAQFSVTGYGLSPDKKSLVLDVDAEKARFEKQRDVFRSSNPNGAFIFHQGFDVRSSLPYSGQLVDALAPLADGVIIDCDGIDNSESLGRSLLAYQTPNSLIKIARRNVEEAANFDLPIFARFMFGTPDFQLLRAYQDGASNIIVPEGRQRIQSPVLDVLTRHSARLSGAVTLEDVGLQIDDFERFAPILRRIGRVPLLARLPGDGNGEKKNDDKSAESLFVAFDSSTNVATLDKIERAARVGATIYCEGAIPPALIPRWSEITKTQITPLATAQKATVTLAEPWFWGTLNDQNFDVLQSVTINIKPSIAAQTRDVKGQALETVARPIARFNDDPNAIMLCPVGKGRILWAPFDVSRPAAPTTVAANPLNIKGLSMSGRARTKIADSILYDNDLELTSQLTTASPNANQSVLNAYYSAVAGAMQASLVSYSATKGDASAVSVAVRALPADPANPRSSAISLVAFFNSSNAPVELAARLRGNGGYALDLMNDQVVPGKIRDFGTNMSLQIPANGFRWIAVAKDAQAWTDAAKGKVKAQLR